MYRAECGKSDCGWSLEGDLLAEVRKAALAHRRTAGHALRYVGVTNGGLTYAQFQRRKYARRAHERYAEAHS